MPPLLLPQNLFRTISKWLAKMVQSHRPLQPGLQLSSVLSYYTETGQQMIQLSLPGLGNYSNFNFLRVP